jgi:capsular polysaccharide biosynthesis protein
MLPKEHPLLATRQIDYRETWVKGCKDLKVYGPTVSVIDEAEHLLADVSVEWGRKAEENWTFRRFILPKGQLVSGRTLVLASTGGGTYFHWITDVLPRFRLAQRAGYNISIFDHVLVNGLDQRFQQETMQRLGILPERCLLLAPYNHALCLEEAVLPSLPGVPGVVPPETIDFLQSIFTAKIIVTGRRIFIGRGGAKHRALIYELEIAARLSERGFESVECEKLSVQQQADIFSSAEVVVGAHGAALTNLVFCRPGTRVVELFSPAYVNPCYRDLCVAAKLRHAAVIGSGKDWVMSERHDQPSAPITASWELVEKALADFVR